MSATVFIFNPLAKGTLSLLSMMNGRRRHKSIIRKLGDIIMRFSDDSDDDSEYEDPSPEELLDWIYSDEDSRPEEDQYGD